MFDPNLKEQWVLCPGFSKYKISNFGRILKIQTFQLLKHCENDKGYAAVCLQQDNIVRPKGEYKLVHILVAKTFIPNPNNLPEVNHEDGDKFNPRVDNLEWVTHQQNVQHAWDTGLTSSTAGIHIMSKSVRLRNTGEVFGSIAEASRRTGIHASQISLFCNGVNNAKYAGRDPITKQPLIWEFA